MPLIENYAEAPMESRIVPEIMLASGGRPKFQRVETLLIHLAERLGGVNVDELKALIPDIVDQLIPL